MQIYWHKILSTALSKGSYSKTFQYSFCINWGSPFRPSSEVCEPTRWTISILCMIHDITIRLLTITIQWIYISLIDQLFIKQLSPWIPPPSTSSPREEPTFWCSIISLSRTRRVRRAEKKCSGDFDREDGRTRSSSPRTDRHKSCIQFSSPF